MSYNFNNYNYYHGNTFQSAQYLPPPPPPPAYFFPPQEPWDQSIHDTNYVKQLESTLPIVKQSKTKCLMPISSVRNEICNLISQLKELKSKEKMLSDEINVLSDEEWNNTMKQIEVSKASINKILYNINNLNVEILQKQISKRLAKRTRMKRLRSERRREKDEYIKQMQEKSRNIDEKLQKIQDDIQKAKQEEEAKVQADIVLKETLRKKHDAKKVIVKLNALIKLRRARQNTAKGRGENVSVIEADTFNNNIEKLISLWNQRLLIYQKEEADLRTKLLVDCSVEPLGGQHSQQALVDSLAEWKAVLFGGQWPQVEFASAENFIAVRSSWDMFLSSDGSSLPVGWVLPTAS